jgi:hypothetical protein
MEQGCYVSISLSILVSNNVSYQHQSSAGWKGAANARHSRAFSSEPNRMLPRHIGHRINEPHRHILYLGVCT